MNRKLIVIGLLALGACSSPAKTESTETEMEEMTETAMDTVEAVTDSMAVTADSVMAEIDTTTVE